MALSLGVNSGFVAVAPTADPSALNLGIDNGSKTCRDTTSSGTTKITEVGWWCDNSTEEANFEVGLYSNDGGNAGDLLFSEIINAKGTSSGWKTVSVDWDVDESTIYHIAVQLDNTSTATNTNAATSGGDGISSDFGASALLDPWDGAATNEDWALAFYAVEEAGAAVINPKVKIGGTFSTKPIKVKIGGTFVEKPQKVKVGGTFQ